MEFLAFLPALQVSWYMYRTSSDITLIVHYQSTFSDNFVYNSELNYIVCSNYLSNTLINVNRRIHQRSFTGRPNRPLVLFTRLELLRAQKSPVNNRS